MLKGALPIPLYTPLFQAVVLVPRGRSKLHQPSLPRLPAHSSKAWGFILHCCPGTCKYLDHNRPELNEEMN